MTITTEIVFSGYVPGNNGPKGLLRMHYRKRIALRDAYQIHIRSQTRHRHPGPVAMVLTRYGIGREMDFDNLVSTGKVLTDAFVLAGVIFDDNPAIITQRTYRFVRVRTAAEQKTVVCFTDTP